jgi:hypothetical protein
LERKGIAMMSTQISVEKMVSILNQFLDETFEKVGGIYLDRGTSLFETLEVVTAEEASRRVGGKCASIAGQVEHTRFYLEMLMRYLRGEEPENVDWPGSWWLTEVTEEQWESTKGRLREEYGRVRELIKGIEDWSDGERMGDAWAIVAHTAYHLGEIRQAMCTVVGSS